MKRARDRDAAGRPSSGESQFGHSAAALEAPVPLFDQLADCAGSFLGSGYSCLIVATAEHSNRLADRLAEFSIDLRQATSANRYIVLDAKETLDSFMVEGQPDGELFGRTIEPMLAKAESAAIRKPGSVFVFGEMMALLWDVGCHDAAIQIEQFWNDLVAKHGFSLLRACPGSSFRDCSQHDLLHGASEQDVRVATGENDPTTLSGESERGRMASCIDQGASLISAAVEDRERAIAQRKHAEDKLWRSEEFTRRIVESCVDCLYVLDLEGRLEYVSPAGQAALEIADLNGFLGRPWVELWREEGQLRVEAGLKAARSGGVGIFQADSPTESGARKHWDVRIAPMRGRDGAIEQFVAVSRDITEQRQAQQIAIQAEKLAAAGRMAATIAHEINNPLEAVTNFIYLARTTPEIPENSARYLEIADRELTRVAQMAQKTLGFYRDTSSSKWIGVSEIVDDVLLIYERKLRYKQMKASVAVEPELKAFAKQGELKQALSNLLANAIDASREGGTIWLRAHASHNWTNGLEPGVRITLADNGTGMAPEIKKRIFVPFFTTKVNIGTGIGLWVTKSLIEQQGGYLRFRSSQGQHAGTVMSFFLPASPNKRTQEVAA